MFCHVRAVLCSIVLAATKSIVYIKDTRAVLGIFLKSTPAKTPDRVNIELDNGSIIYGAKSNNVLTVSVSTACIPEDIYAMSYTMGLDSCTFTPVVVSTH